MCNKFSKLLYIEKLTILFIVLCYSCYYQSNLLHISTLCVTKLMLPNVTLKYFLR